MQIKRKELAYVPWTKETLLQADIVNGLWKYEEKDNQVCNEQKEPKVGSTY